MDARTRNVTTIRFLMGQIQIQDKRNVMDAEDYSGNGFRRFECRRSPVWAQACSKA
jgi:hypothetical protein